MHYVHDRVCRECILVRVCLIQIKRNRKKENKSSRGYVDFNNSQRKFAWECAGTSSPGYPLVLSYIFFFCRTVRPLVVQVRAPPPTSKPKITFESRSSSHMQTRGSATTWSAYRISFDLSTKNLKMTTKNAARSSTDIRIYCDSGHDVPQQTPLDNSLERRGTHAPNSSIDKVASPALPAHLDDVAGIGELATVLFFYRYYCTGIHMYLLYLLRFYTSLMMSLTSLEEIFHFWELSFLGYR